MAKITLHSDNIDSATSVSNLFIDEYMADANGEFVKIYLYLLRLLNRIDTAFSISSIADKFNHTEKDVQRALNYWERMHLLRMEYDESEHLTGICMLNFTKDTQQQGFTITIPSDTPQESSRGVPPEISSANGSAKMFSDARPEYPPVSDAIASQEVPIAERKEYSADDISNFRQEDCVAELIFITERYLGRTLNPTDINTILYLYDGIKFSADLIEYLIEYCVSKGHTSIRYIEKTGLAWAKDNIHTVEEAKRSAGIHNQTAAIVQKAFGIKGRSLVSTETEFIRKWKNTYGFSNELIQNACGRTITATHQPSFEYTDRILSDWYRHKVKNQDDIAKLDHAYQHRKKPAVSAAPIIAKNRFNNFKHRTYDYDQLEKMLLTTDAR